MDTYLPSEERADSNHIINKPLKIAVIGSGIAGLSAAWLLSKKHNVTIYEKESKLGGHANTISINYPISNNKTFPINVDTGFIVYNNKNYPNLTNFFNELNVKSIDSQMSLSISLDNGKYEYSGSGINGVFGQRKNIININQWKLIFDIFKFKKLASKYIEENQNTKDNLEQWLIKNKFSNGFIKNYIIPISSAIWSCSHKDSLMFPAQAFLYFFYHHGLLNLKNRPQWKTVKNGSREYINKVIETSNFNYQTNTKITSIETKNNSVYVEIDNSKIQYDHVIMACHADQSLNILKKINHNIFNVLKNFKFSENKIILHSSPQFMPKINSLWSSWNYFSNNNSNYKNIDNPVQMTYWMNSLQKINNRYPLFITLNPNKNDIASHYIFKEILYKHPILDEKALLSQSKLHTIQGKDNIWYVGAWTGYGFHEDGIKSGLQIAKSLGCECPWETDNINIKEKIYTSL